ncbi:hypothetical protein [Microbacterium aureliae]
MHTLIVWLAAASFALPVAGLAVYLVRDARHARRVAAAQTAARNAAESGHREELVNIFGAIGVRPPTGHDVNHLPLYVLEVMNAARGARPVVEFVLITLGLACGALAAVLSLGV